VSEESAPSKRVAGEQLAALVNAEANPPPNARLTMRMPSPVPAGKGSWPDRSHSEEVRFVGSSGVRPYRLVGDVSMPGTWTLHLAASVPGEASEVEGSTKFVAGRERYNP
jgi:hypothetical protein